MQYSVEEIKQYAAEEDVKFIRMAFCDAAGRQKNIAIMPEELDRAFQYGIAIDGSAIPGFGGEVHSDLLLRPDPSTLCVLPWRPEHGRVVRMFCAVTQPDGTVIGADARSLWIRWRPGTGCMPISDPSLWQTRRATECTSTSPLSARISGT